MLSFFILNLNVTLAGLSTAIVVNSQFTAGIFEDTFQSIRRRPQVLYPSLSFDKFDQPFNPTLSSITGFSEPKFVCLSINRYERKKNLALALQAFGSFRLFCFAKKCHT